MAEKGVNLGGWLVLEKWMTPYMFADCDAEDELSLYKKLDASILKERYALHRKSYITERDFQLIQKMGLDFVRLPIPYFIFDDVAPYVGCINYVDQAFTWAETYGLKILLDLHTVPEGQNGLDNSGLKGICKWHTKQVNIDQAVYVIERLAMRYGQHPHLYGIEVLNEPADEAFWKQGPSHFVCEDPKMQEGSSFVPTEVLKEYYERCYKIIDDTCAPNVSMVIHDGFRVKEFYDFMPKNAYPRLMVDMHLYLNFEQHGKSDIPFMEYERILKESYREIIQETAQHHRVLIGEWSMGNHLASKEKNNPECIKDLFFKQMQVFDESDGWCFWNYKMTAAARMHWDYELLYLAYIAERKNYEHNK